MKRVGLIAAAFLLVAGIVPALHADVYAEADEANTVNTENTADTVAESGLTMTPEAAGWVSEAVSENGNQVTKWKYDRGTGFFTSADGVVTIGSAQYTFDSAGYLLVGAQTVGGKQYFFQTEGGSPTASGSVYGQAAKNAWKLAGTGIYYYYGADGSRDASRTGMQKIGDAYYFLNAQGVVQTGFQKSGGKTYYFGNDGKRKNYQKWNTIDGKKVFFHATKYYVVIKKGFQTIDSKKYYFDANGKMLTGFQTINGKRYYFGTKGVMAVGLKTIKSKIYFFNNNGTALKKSWKTVGSKKYYFQANYTAKTNGLLKVSGKTYYFGPKGAVQKGWKTINGSRYYFDKTSGVMATNKWVGDYYLQKDGKMATSTWIGQYYVGANGKWIKNYVSGSSNLYEGTWKKVNGKYKFLPAGTKKYATNKWIRLDDNWYYVDNDGYRVTGWKYIGSYKYYFNSNGTMNQDLRSQFSNLGSYKITVNRTHCIITVFAKDGTNGYTIPIKAFACSVGLPATPTPTGTYYTTRKERWHELMGPSYGQYCTNVVGGVWFHSVAGINMTSYNISAGAYNMLGSPASHGCIRMTVADAKWIFDNCSVGIAVQIFDNSSVGPFDKPATIKIPEGQNWDPTDPAVKK